MRSRTPSRWLLAFLLLASMTPIACGPSVHSARAVTAAATVPIVSDYTIAIGAARAARDRAEALHPPPPADLESLSSSDEALAEVLKRWATARRDATQEAERAYVEALKVARGPSDEAEVHGEIATLWLGLQEDTESALLAAAPAKVRDEPSLVSFVQIGTSIALRPLREHIAKHLTACKQLVTDAPWIGFAGKSCVESSARFDDTIAQHGARAAAGQPSSAVAIAPSEPRPIVPTTHPKPCTFKGTVVTKGTIYADESGTSSLLTVDLTAPIEVESIDVPQQLGGRYKVVVSWPKAVEGYLDAQEQPLVLKRQVELVPGATWVAEGERVAAGEARGPTVRISRAFADAAAAPKKLDRRLFCHDMELATTASPPRSIATAEGK